MENTFYTGLEGFLRWELVVKGMTHKIKGIAHTKYIKQQHALYLSIGTKHGPYKIFMYPNKHFRFHLYKGTIIISQSDNLKDLVDKVLNLEKL